MMKKIGEVFINNGLISRNDLQVALKQQEQTHDRLGDIIIRMGLASPEKLTPVLAEYFDIPFINLKEIYKDIKAEVVDTIPEELARRFCVMSIQKEDNLLSVAMLDPLDLLTIDTLKMKTGYKIKCVLATENEIQEAIEYCYHNLPKMKRHIAEYIDAEVDEQKESDLTIEAASEYGASDQPVVQYVRSLVVQAVNKRASDIHLQPKEKRADLRIRIDGILYHLDPPPKAMLSAINTRIKILAGLDIAERRLPQDGRFKMRIGKMEVDLRVSCFPTIYGESVVMRILETSQPLLGLEHLGFSPENLVQFKKIISHSYGLVLVTGPTGSGKTTTLYTTLNEIKSDEKNILTIEDPVEYRLPFIQQSQVNPQIGFDFARGLRSILRQDPDIIMIGEIRDQETAEIAIHAALTGHLVFATLHTNDSASAAVRLVKMGVEPFLITSSLLGVIAQRLIRIICPHCKELYNYDEVGLPEGINVKKLFHGTGCSKCNKTGYKGRKGIYELFVPNEPIRKLILELRSSEEIRTQAQKSGMKTLREMGVELLKQGVTTPEEMLRVTQETEDM